MICLRTLWHITVTWGSNSRKGFRCSINYSGKDLYFHPDSLQSLPGKYKWHMLKANFPPVAPVDKQRGFLWWISTFSPESALAAPMPSCVCLAASGYCSTAGRQKQPWLTEWQVGSGCVTGTAPLLQLSHHDYFIKSLIKDEKPPTYFPPAHCHLEICSGGHFVTSPAGRISR